MTKVSLYRTDKCHNCYLCRIEGGCLIIDTENLQPPQCKDGTCNLRILNTPKRFQEWFLKALKEKENQNGKQ